MNEQLATIPATAELMRQATDVAGVCKDIVTKTALSIQGRKYVRVEGWMSIATAHGCIASARSVEVVEGGIKAIAEIKRMSDGMVLAAAEGFVGDDEPTWFGGILQTNSGPKTLPKRPAYAIRAMAQTRAISRACRTAFAHVVVLMDAGLQTTPAEEVQDGGFEDRPAIFPPRTEPKNVTPAPTVPRDQVPAGSWTDAVIPFGKDKGKNLGSLPASKLSWYANTWQPQPFRGNISEADKELRAALDSYLAGHSVQPDQPDEYNASEEANKAFQAAGKVEDNLPF